MGVVVAARHEQLGFRVALKFMLPIALGDQGMKERFLREARAAGRLRSEHVARVMDFGTLEGGAPYIVMEFLEGEDLDELASRKGRIAVHEASEYVLQACKAMAEAHAVGIVHRDLKPQNLFLTRRPDGTPLVKVLDFGISKLVDGEAASVSMTSSRAMMGSPLYMPPEQVRSAKNVDARADIYSLGVILYQLTTGVTPVQADTLGELFETLFTKATIPPRERCSDIPHDFNAVVMRCLAKEPNQRFATAGELGAQLAPFTDPRRSSAPMEEFPATERAPSDRGVSTTLGNAVAASNPLPIDVPGMRRSSTAIWTVGGALALVVCGAAALIVGTRSRAPSGAQPSGSTSGASATEPSASAAAAPDIPPPPSATATASSAPTVAAEPSSPPPSAAPTAHASSRPAPAKTPKPTTAASASARSGTARPPHGTVNADPFGSPD